MKKEISIVVVLVLHILSSVIDYLSGPVTPLIRNPIAFLASRTLYIYPFTAVAVFANIPMAYMEIFRQEMSRKIRSLCDII